MQMASPVRLLAAVAGAAIAAAAGAKYTLDISVGTLSVPAADTVVSWTGIAEARSGDWVAICCPDGTYFWWLYTSGASSGSVNTTLWANGKASNCDTIHAAYYDGSNAVLGTSPEVAITRMIQQVHLSLSGVDANAVVVDYVSSGADAPSQAANCSYGTSPGALTFVAPSVVSSFATIGHMLYAVMSGLKPGTKYFYACGDGHLTSQTFSFTHKPADHPPRVAVVRMRSGGRSGRRCPKLW
jgi:hypothetical protein